MSKIEKIIVQNIKCQGCVKTISDALIKLDGIEQVEVDITDQQVTVNGQDPSLKNILSTLTSLGFPARD